MTDFLSRLAARAQGSVPLVKPLLAPSTAPIEPAMGMSAAAGSRSGRLEPWSRSGGPAGQEALSGALENTPYGGLERGLEESLEVWEEGLEAPAAPAPPTVLPGAHPRTTRSRPPASPGRMTPAPISSASMPAESAGLEKHDAGVTVQSRAEETGDPPAMFRRTAMMGGLETDRPLDSQRANPGQDTGYGGPVTARGRLEPAIPAVRPLEAGARTFETSPLATVTPWNGQALEAEPPAAPTMPSGPSAVAHRRDGTPAREDTPYHFVMPRLDLSPSSDALERLERAGGTTPSGDGTTHGAWRAEPGTPLEEESRSHAGSRPEARSHADSRQEARSHANSRLESAARSTGAGPVERDPARAPMPDLEPPVVHVTIGRIEVRAVAPQPPPPVPRPAAPSRARPALSLDAYLKQRGGRAR